MTKTKQSPPTMWFPVDDDDDDIADRPPQNPETWDVERTRDWEIYQGNIRLFIVGPGPDSWCPASEPQYDRRKPLATVREFAIARQAVAALRLAKKLNCTQDEIMELLTKLREEN